MIWKQKTEAECIAAGRDPSLLTDGALHDELIIELAPDGDDGATVVWQWSLFDHLVQDYDDSKAQ